jgi:3-(3-hydroxy-phenyl)propionate hydroxylase
MSSPSFLQAGGTGTPEIDTDILLVGLGPVGAAMANLLGRYGMRVVAIDCAIEIFMKPRAIALDHEALRILQMAGLEDGSFSTVAIPQVLYHSPLFGRFGRINCAGIVNCHTRLVTFYQPELERVLRERLAKYPSVELRLGVELESFVDDGHHVLAQLKASDGRSFQARARYLVGADGANSVVRQLLGLTFEGRSFREDWLIVDARGVPNPIDHVELICNPKRPTPHMVAPGGRERWEFKLNPGETPEEMERPETVRRLLSPWCNVDGIEIERTAVYRFHAREAQSFSKGRCFLVGDAAHITPPFAGQGLVSGLRDVANLAWKLAWVVRGHANERLLASYDQERRPHARKMIKLARFLGALVMPSNWLTAFALHGLVSAIRLLPVGRSLFDDLKMKPANTFDEGFFWRERRAESLRAGSTFPQGWVRTAAGQDPMLSDDALGCHWALITFGADPTAHVRPKLMESWSRIGGKVWQWCQRSQSPHMVRGGDWLEALDEALPLREAALPWAAIVRPDRCVLAEGPASQVEALLEQALKRLNRQ